MSPRHRWFCALVVACCVVAVIRTSSAQGQLKPSTNKAAPNKGGLYGAGRSGAAPGRQGPQQPMAVPIEFSGTLQQMRGAILQVSNDKQEQYLVKVDPRHTKVQCTGTAEPAFLRTGLYVRLSGDFDNHGNAQGDVSELEIVSLSDTVRAGVMRDDPAAAANEKPKKKVKNEGGKFIVVGQIRSIKNGQLLVAAPGATAGLKITLATDAKINVDVSDPTFVQQGDEVAVKGNIVQPAQNGQPAQVTAGELTVKLSKPLTALSKKATPRAAAGPRGNKKLDKDAEQTAPGGTGKQPGA